MDKEHRHASILELLSRENISSQEELRERLLGLGLDVTQATLSRDLRELNVVKIRVREGQYKYTVLDAAVGPRILRCESSGNLLVLHTEVGLAPAIAYRIDDLELSEVLGTVAGENTVLVVLAENADGQDVERELWERI